MRVDEPHKGEGIMDREAYKQKLIRDLENAYEYALEKGNITAAIKAKELLGREFGFLEKEKDRKQRLLDLYQHLSEGELEEFLDILQGQGIENHVFLPE